jgi:MYXO-CTERM domain-containing protein
MRHVQKATVILCALSAVGGVSLFVASSARADIPAGYAGTPFNPAVAGGAGIIPTTVKAGPYVLPGRLDFVNYDLGGVGVAFQAGDKDLMKAGYGYRTDHPAATISKTSVMEGDVWYNTNTSLDGTQYQSTTVVDFYLGAIQVGDWFNFTVNVQTAGTYTLSSTWSSGNGPPGGEGGDGSMGLEVFVNDTKVATWTAEFPNYMTKANFHNWIPYPNIATITLEAGPQLIKLQSTTKHLNLDYVDFEIAGDGGAATSGDAGADDASNSGASSGSAGGSGAASGASSGASLTSSGSASGAGAGTAGAPSGGTSGGSGSSVIGTSGTVSNSGAMSSSGSNASGAGNGGNGASTAPTSSGKGCSVGPASTRAHGGISLLLALGGFFLMRRRSRRI